MQEHPAAQSLQSPSKAQASPCRVTESWLRTSHLHGAGSRRESWTRWKSTWPRRYMVWKMFCME